MLERMETFITLLTVVMQCKIFTQLIGYKTILYISKLGMAVIKDSLIHETIQFWTNVHKVHSRFVLHTITIKRLFSSMNLFNDVCKLTNMEFG